MSEVLRYPLYHQGQHVATLFSNLSKQLDCQAELPYQLVGWKTFTRDSARALLPEVHRGMTRQQHHLFDVVDVPKSLVVYASLRPAKSAPKLHQHDEAGSLWLVLDDFFEGRLDGLVAVSLQESNGVKLPPARPRSELCHTLR